MKDKALKSIIALATVSVLTGCTAIPLEEDTVVGINWWQTAIFTFLWLFLSCPIITRIVAGEEYNNDDPEEKSLNRTIAGTAVYAFPIMYIASTILNYFCEWYINYIISIVIGAIIGSIIRAKYNPLCDAYIKKTMWLWIGQLIFTIIAVILAVNN